MDSVASAPRGRRSLSRSPRILAILLALTSTLVRADEPEGVDLLKTDSLAPYVHRLTLYDHEGKAIDPKDEPAVPYSPAMTCGKCHPYAEISHGWHFNAADPNVPAGRPGEPWILVDERTGTVLPISGRRWPGTWTPQEIGLTNWQFAKRFGGHTPGGGYGAPGAETLKNAPEAQRWRISGALEIDCMFCHSADPQHDPAEASRQIAAENFRWAPTASFGLAVVRGEARKAPDDWDPEAPPNPDYPDQAGPKLVWDKRRFDPDNRVLFDITRSPSEERCYFCHTVREVGPQASDDMLRSRDVHLIAGLVCADCHRNEVDHQIARGFGGEAAQRGETWRATYSCAGCHLGTESDGDDDAPVPLFGRYGAPRPEHRGLPPVHFEKLTCTACHSGPWPEMVPKQVQTALAHGLGLPTRDRASTDLPIIVEPIFAWQPDGKLAPQRMIWPAYWGWLDQGKIVPISPESVLKVAGRILPKPAKTTTQPAKPFDDAMIQQVLAALAGSAGRKGEPVYVHGYRTVGQTGALALPAVEPYRWSLAHDVRPVSQSLGVKGCTDCHSGGAPLYFGNTGIDSPWAAPGDKWMVQLRGDDPGLATLWAIGFQFRPIFKYFGFTCAGIVLLLLTRVALGRAVAGDVHATPPRIEVWARVIALAGIVVGAVTSFGPQWVLGTVGEYWLLTHMVAAGLFTLGLTLSTLFWVRRRHTGAVSPSALRALAFWLVLALGLAVLLTMLAAMVPVFGTAGQRDLIEWHTWASIGLIFMIVVYGVLAVATRRAKRTTP